MVSRRSAPETTLSRGDVVEIAITDLLANGQGVGRAAGVVVFVWGPLPGERALVRITLVKAKYAVAEMLELLDRSPERTDPFCSVFGICGGCQVQHLAYSAQLKWKRDVIRNALERIGGLRDAPVSAVQQASDSRRYRNKMALVVRPGPASARFGFYQARSHDIVPIGACPVVLPQLDRVIAQLHSASRAPETARAFDGARHVVARTARASSETVVAVTTDRPSAQLRGVGATLRRAMPGVVGICNSFAPSSANAVIGSKTVLVDGEPEIEEAIGGLRFRVSAASFFQINSEMVGAIFAFLERCVRDGMRILDLYCGAGTFALFFARQGATVLGVEESRNAVREARANAARNGLNRATFVAGRVEDALPSGLVAEALVSVDAVFLDPPRKGSDEVTLRAIAAARVPAIWYLSCNPATLARDLALLVGAGYRLDAVQPFDMFPQTGHVEALAMLRRGP